VVSRCCPRFAPFSKGATAKPAGVCFLLVGDGRGFVGALSSAREEGTRGERFFASVWLHGLCGRGGLGAAAVSVRDERLPSDKRKVFFESAMSE